MHKFIRLQEAFVISLQSNHLYYKFKGIFHRFQCYYIHLVVYLNTFAMAKNTLAFFQFPFLEYCCAHWVKTGRPGVMVTMLNVIAFVTTAERFNLNMHMKWKIPLQNNTSDILPW